MISTIYLFGEGASDLGGCTDWNSHDGMACVSPGFVVGPMGELLLKHLSKIRYPQHDWIGDQLETLTVDGINFVYFSYKAIKQYVDSKGLKSSNRFRPSLKTPKGVAANAMQAWVLGLLAKDGDADLAVIFHDVDGTKSEKAAQPRRYEELRLGFEEGFLEAEFPYGVVMVPKPKSEAWLIFSLQDYQNGEKIEENLSGNDRSPKSAAKAVLAELLGEEGTTKKQCEVVRNRVDPERLCSMPSYNDFATNLKEAVLKRFTDA